jgi:hypothetical protein
MPELLQMLLTAFVSSQVPGTWSGKWRCHMPVLPNGGLCRSRNSEHQFPATRYNFLVVVRYRVVETDWLQSLYHGKCGTPPCRPWLRIILLCETWQKWPFRLTYMNWPHHFEHCILETVWMETQGSSLRFWNRKCIKWAKKLFCH